MARVRFEAKVSTFRLAKEDLQAAQKLAESMQVTTSDIIRMAIREYLQKQSDF